jgi:hypothetical protein
MATREHLITGIVAVAITGVGALSLNPVIAAIGLNMGSGLAATLVQEHINEVVRRAFTPWLQDPDIQRALKHAFINALTLLPSG